MFQKTADMLFLTRPVLLIPVWAFFVYGYIEALGHSGRMVLGSLSLPFGLRIIWDLPGSVYITLAGFTVLMAGIQVLNQIADVDADRKNTGFPLLARGVVSIKKAAWLTGVLLFLAMALSWTLDVATGILFSGALLLGFLYCMPPFRWSGRPILDFLSNATGYGLITFCLGWYASGSGLSAETLKYASPYFALMAAGSVASTIPDLPGDTVERKETTAVRFGIRNCAIIGLICLGMAIALSLWFRLAVPFFVGVLSVPFFIMLASKPIRTNGYPAYQIGGGALILIALLSCPPLLVLSLAVFFSTRLYFWKAHRVRYPEMGH